MERERICKYPAERTCQIMKNKKNLKKKIFLTRKRKTKKKVKKNTKRNGKSVKNFGITKFTSFFFSFFLFFVFRIAAFQVLGEWRVAGCVDNTVETATRFMILVVVLNMNGLHWYLCASPA